jgi:hypothetical protein
LPWREDDHSFNVEVENVWQLCISLYIFLIRLLDKEEIVTYSITSYEILLLLFSVLVSFSGLMFLLQCLSLTSL